jgi:Trp operon repressor
MEEVVAAFLAVRDASECADLLDAMLTSQELEQIPVRWQLLRKLMSEQVSQRKLAEIAGVAPATAARAHKAFGAHGPFLRTLVQRVEMR